MYAQGLLPKPEPEPSPPQGQARYLIAVEGHVTKRGIDHPSVIAAQLRAAADQLDPPRKVHA